MGNAQQAAQQAALQPCDQECQHKKKLANAEAAWQAISSNPDADPVARQEAYEAYMKALHGPNWKFDKEQREKAKAAGPGKMSSMPRPMDQGQLKRLQKETASLHDDINKLEEQLAAVKQKIAQETEAVRELDKYIDKGTVYALQLKRVIALKEGVLGGRAPSISS